jgi:hypothetical protein
MCSQFKNLDYPITLLLYTNYFIILYSYIDIDIGKDYSSIEYTDNQQIN